MIEQFKRVYLHREALDSEVAKRIISLASSAIVEVVDDPPLAERAGELSAAEFSESKRLLYVTPFRGEFFKRCPGARPGLTCCNYFVLNLGLQCNMNCSYCYLQSFINTPVTTIYSNIDKALSELREMGRTLSDQTVRIGTGEVIDSLSLDPLTLYSRQLIQFFRQFPKWSLEFKTKSALVEQFLDVESAGNVIVSWSINPQNIIAAEEHGTADLDSRLRAARQCLDRGLQVAFHIDPMIWHPDWRASYLNLVDAVTREFRAGDVNVISVGGLRFQPQQRHIMRERFGMQSLVTQAEVFLGEDGKLRYDQKVRSEMFKFVIDEFKKRDAAWKIFLCMETPESWLGTFKSMPKSVHGLEDMFDHRVIRKFKMPEAETRPNSQ